MCLSRNWKVLVIIYVILVALFTTWLICSSNVSFESKVTPRSFCLSCVYCFCNIVRCCIIVTLSTLFLPISIRLHLSG